MSVCVTHNRIGGLRQKRRSNWLEWGWVLDVVFRSDGDAEHIHQTLLGTFPILAECGGYSLLRLAENSHAMVEIDGPFSVSYLKDILNHAKLYVRPLQKDITEEDMRDYLGSKVISFSVPSLLKIIY